MATKLRTGTARRFIVKVQRSILNTLGGKTMPPHMLIYNKSRKIRYEARMTGDVKKMLGKALKGYFYAFMDGTIIVFDGPAPEQNW